MSHKLKILVLIIVHSIFLNTNVFAINKSVFNNEADSLNYILVKSKISSCERVSIFNKQGEKNQKEKKYIKAIDYFKYALIYLDSCGNKFEKAQVYEHIADVYNYVNDYERALPLYFDAIKKYSLISKPKNIIHILDGLSSIYLNLEMFSNALYCLNFSQKYYIKNKKIFKNELSSNSLKIGVVYARKGNFDSSLFFFKRALSFISESDSSNTYGGILNNVGAIYSKMNKNDTASKYYNKAYLFFIRVGNKKGIGVSLGNIAYLDQKEKKYSAAVEKYLKAIKYLVDANASFDLLNIYQNLGDSYKIIGKYKEALIYNEKYLSLKDSIASTDRINNLMETETRYKIAEKDNELKILEQQKLIIQRDNKIKVIRQYYLIGCLILLLILGYFAFRNLKFSINNIKLKHKLLFKEKQQLATELELKNALRIAEKNEFLENLKKEITTIPSADENIKRLLNISNSIRSNLTIDSETLELEDKINQVYNGFFSKLDIKFPLLTKTEKRLCSLMILNLSTKDIASIMNISPESVKKGRYRLRKKLNLESDDDISNYLKSL